LAAVRATYFETRQTANGGTPMLNSDGEQIDLLTQELEKVDHVDPVMSTGSIGGGTGQDGPNGGMVRERTSSLALTIGSDGGLGGTENERLLAQHQPMVSLTSSAKMSFESPNTSGRNTPTLTSKSKRHLFNPEQSTSPPSLTDESPLSKNRSLT
jgi:hypothetical protein